MGITPKPGQTIKSGTGFTKRKAVSKIVYKDKKGQSYVKSKLSGGKTQKIYITKQIGEESKPVTQKQVDQELIKRGLKQPTVSQQTINKARRLAQSKQKTVTFGAGSNRYAVSRLGAIKKLNPRETVRQLQRESQILRRKFESSSRLSQSEIEKLNQQRNKWIVQSSALDLGMLTPLLRKQFENELEKQKRLQSQLQRMELAGKKKLKGGDIDLLRSSLSFGNKKIIVDIPKKVPIIVKKGKELDFVLEGGKFALKESKSPFLKRYLRKIIRVIPKSGDDISDLFKIAYNSWIKSPVIGFKKIADYESRRRVNGNNVRLDDSLKYIATQIAYSKTKDKTNKERLGNEIKNQERKFISYFKESKKYRNDPNIQSANIIALMVMTAGAINTGSFVYAKKLLPYIDKATKGVLVGSFIVNPTKENLVNVVGYYGGSKLLSVLSKQKSIVKRVRKLPKSGEKATPNIVFYDEVTGKIKYSNENGIVKSVGKIDDLPKSIRSRLAKDLKKAQKDRDFENKLIKEKSKEKKKISLNEKDGITKFEALSESVKIRINKITKQAILRINEISRIINNKKVSSKITNKKIKDAGFNNKAEYNKYESLSKKARSGDIKATKQLESFELKIKKRLNNIRKIEYITQDRRNKFNRDLRRINREERLRLNKKAKKTKIDKDFDKLEEELNKIIAKEQRLKAKKNKDAQKSGFKDFEEQELWKDLSEKVKKGSRVANVKLKLLERKISKRASEQAKKRAKQIKEFLLNYQKIEVKLKPLTKKSKISKIKKDALKKTIRRKQKEIIVSQVKKSSKQQTQKERSKQKDDVVFQIEDDKKRIVFTRDKQYFYKKTQTKTRSGQMLVQETLIEAKTIQPKTVKQQLQTQKTNRVEKTKQVNKNINVIQVQKQKIKSKLKSISKQKKVLKQKIKSKPTLILQQKLGQASKQESQFKNMYKIASLSENKYKSIGKSINKVSNIFKDINILKPKDMYKNVSKIIPKSKVTTISKIKPKTPQLTKPLKPIEPIKPIRIIIPKNEKKNLKLGKKQGYNVWVRLKTKYKKINSVPLPMITAQRQLRGVLDHSTSASGLIRLARGKRQKSRLKILKTSSSKFRRPKGKTRLPKRSIVEKRNARIDTRGEKMGLGVSKLVRRLRKRKVPKKRKVSKKRKKKK